MRNIPNHQHASWVLEIRRWSSHIKLFVPTAPFSGSVQRSAHFLDLNKEILYLLVYHRLLIRWISPIRLSPAPVFCLPHRRLLPSPFQELTVPTWLFLLSLLSQTSLCHRFPILQLPQKSPQRLSSSTNLATLTQNIHPGRRYHQIMLGIRFVRICLFIHLHFSHLFLSFLSYSTNVLALLSSWDISMEAFFSCADISVGMRILKPNLSFSRESNEKKEMNDGQNRGWCTAVWDCIINEELDKRNEVEYRCFVKLFLSILKDFRVGLRKDNAYVIKMESFLPRASERISTSLENVASGQTQNFLSI